MTIVFLLAALQAFFLVSLLLAKRSKPFADKVLLAYLAAVTGMRERLAAVDFSHPLPFAIFAVLVIVAQGLGRFALKRPDGANTEVRFESMTVSTIDYEGVLFRFNASATSS